ncbi:MAG: hypothetical protein JST00_34235 [Deltaproteobacteria bacterium]|nr:hypothetical protein [Deltaproteobacteria bacterium]
MRRTATVLVTATALGACDGGPPTPVSPRTRVDPSTITSATAPSTNAAGMVGGRVFVAQGAIVLRPTGGEEAPKVTSLRIFARTVACSDVVKGNLAFYGDEPGVEIQLERGWPVSPGTTWSAGEGGEVRDPVTVWFRRGFGTGATARGSVRFPVATTTGGVVTFDLTTENPNLVPSGSVKGTTAFEVCGP